jgi:zinc transporter ZupT
MCLSLLNCFSAGIFLAMSLLHMMPESMEMYQSWVDDNQIGHAFPLPPMVYIVGYMLILLLDQIFKKETQISGNT